jgi:hypothetical protein
MRPRLILGQMAYCLVFLFYLVRVLIEVGEPREWWRLPFPLSWLIGGILSTRDRITGVGMMMICSLILLALGVVLQVSRIEFVIQHGGMDTFEEGSPMAFLIGWIFETLIIFIPGVVFASANVLSFRQAAKESKKRAS